MICFFRLRRGTFDLARGMVCSSLRLQQALDSLRLTAHGNEGAATQAALPLRRLLGQDVALERMAALHLSGSGQLEALPRAFVRFHLRHGAISVARVISARESSSSSSLPTFPPFRLSRRRRAPWPRDPGRPAPAPDARPADHETSWSPSPCSSLPGTVARD